MSGNSTAPGAPLLEIRNLDLWFDTEQGRVHAVRGVSLGVRAGKTLGIVGESGCGKSVTCHSILRLTPGNGIMAGQILFDAQDLASFDEARLTRLRGHEIAMIFQEPLSALNPVHTIGGQIAESLHLHRGMDKAAARAETLRLLERVGIPEAQRRLREYPHQLSGGMNQRTMIAMALACRPRVLLADEPTTALDATVQIQILLLLRELQRDLGMATIIVTHDLGVACEVADKMAVMYAGRFVETGSSVDVMETPRHPYTRGLFQSTVHGGMRGAPLDPIPGSPPDLAELPPGCAFAPRCPAYEPACDGRVPDMVEVARAQFARCIRCP